MPSPEPANRFLLVYASQTGQAQAIAEEAAEKAAAWGLQAEIHCISMTEKRFEMEKERCVVLISSTTGDGEPPDTALKFYRRIKKRTLKEDHFANMRLAILGLGDSNYTSFCFGPKKLNERLTELGASHFHPPTWADDAVGLETAVEPWLESIFPAIRQELGLSPIEPNMDLVPSKDKKDDSAAPKNNDASDEKNRAAECCDGALDIENLQNDSAIRKDILIQNSGGDNNCSELTNRQNGNISESSVEGSIAKLTLSGGAGETADSNKKLESSTSLQSSELGPASLTNSVPPLSESGLSLPALPPSYLAIAYRADQHVDIAALPYHNGAPFPSAKSNVSMATVTTATRLTREDAVKTALLVTMDVSSAGWSYEPGDSVGVIVPNPADEVQRLLERLGVMDQADLTYELSILENTKKKNASVPSFLPAAATIRHVLTTCCEIRAVPKKAFLRALVECTRDIAEQRRLQELCSRQGASDYTMYIREPGLSLLDVLLAFPSCTPSLALVLEHLPRLQARPYSISSSPLETKGQFAVVFNIVEIPSGCGRGFPRRGVATGWLDLVTQPLQRVEASTAANIQVPVFLRSNAAFRPPSELATTPVIMVGPGTGVAPFLGFLQHRRAQLTAEESVASSDWWLFFGCRHKDRDYLFRDALAEFERAGTLQRLCVSFSREAEQPEDAPRYVQHSLLTHASQVAQVLQSANGRIYVCGDANNMAKNVFSAFAQILTQEAGMDQSAAEKYLMSLKIERRYLEDVWS